MSMSSYLEARILDHITGRTAYTVPTLYIGLSTADPGEDGSTLAEPIAGAYARVLHSGVTKWAAAVNGATATNAEALFPTATSNWGTITHMCLFDAASGGNLLWSGAFTTAKAIGVGDTARIGSGALTLTLD